jgi:hypothetical protein
VINYILGVEDGEDIYFLEKDGSAIEESPQYPTGNQEIVFSATGDGSYSLSGTGGGIVFTEDVILDLAGLGTTLYIAEGSSAGYLTVSATTLSVYGVPTSGFFHIKTDNHTVLKIEPTESTADFTLSSDNVDSSGHLFSWYADSSDSLGFTVGVSTPSMYYNIMRNGLEIDGSPFLSTQIGEDNYEISFSSLGVGTYTISASHLLGNAYMRGWAWSDNIGWICFSSQDDPGSGDFVYGVEVKAEGDLSGHVWSDNIGWISFSEEDLVGCPEGSCTSKLEDEKLKGWGKVLSNDEWISLSGEISGGGEHGVTLVETDFHGWAWGDKTTGWISFNCANNNECGTVNYKVWLSGDVQSTPPAIRTDPATNIRPEGTATLNGTLLSMGGGDSATVWFEWGATQVLGSSTPEMAREIKNAIGSFSEEISVVLGETYYFRAVAENAEGLFYGNILRFTVTERTGQIIINFGDFWRGIEVSEDGRIEILKE